MQSETLTATAEHPVTLLHLRVAWLCGLVLCLEGYDIAAVGYAVPSLVDAWRVPPSGFTQTLTAGNVGLLLGSLCRRITGRPAGSQTRVAVLLAGFGTFSLLSAFASSPLELAALRLLTGLGLGGGIPLAIALVSDFSPRMAQGRLVILTSAGIPIGFTLGGLLATQLVVAFGWAAIFVVGGALPLALLPPLAPTPTLITSFPPQGLAAVGGFHEQRTVSQGRTSRQAISEGRTSPQGETNGDASAGDFSRSSIAPRGRGGRSCRYSAVKRRGLTTLRSRAR